MAREVFNMEKYLQESESLIIDLSNKLYDDLSAVIKEEQKKKRLYPTCGDHSSSQYDNQMSTSRGV